MNTTHQNTHIPKDDNKSEGQHSQGPKDGKKPKVRHIEAGQEQVLGDPENWAADVAYIGQGEWITLKEDHSTMKKVTKLPYMDTWERLQVEIENEDIMMARLVNEKGYPNMFGARLPVKSKWNLEKLEQLLQDYNDKEVIEGLRYGWPTGRLPTVEDPEITYKNHMGAIDYLQEYIKKEQSHAAILGPFKKIPFTNKVGISPISTRPKKNSEDRRIIVDLSFPPGGAGNDGIVRGNYLGFTAELQFPRTDDLAFRAAQLGRNTYMFKIDLSRYFRQIPLDPADYSMVGYIIDG